MISKRIRVFGRVQGVFFRASAKNTAAKFSINGWVKNELDGSVLIEAEGKEPKMSGFIEWCSKGSEFSTVSSTNIEDIALVGYDSFEIRR